MTGSGTSGVPGEAGDAVGEIPCGASAMVCHNAVYQGSPLLAGTGTPEVGGFSVLEAQLMIRELAGLNLVGGDLVEVAPPFDPTGNTALVGASIMYEILCVLAASFARRSAGE